MKTFTVEIPDGFEIDILKSTSNKVVFKMSPTPKLVLEGVGEWSEFKSVSGYYINDSSGLGEVGPQPAQYVANRNIWVTREEAEASLAICQLTRYRNDWCKGWFPNWDDNEIKYCINFIKSTPRIDAYYTTRSVLAFRNEVTAIIFLEHFNALIKKAMPLL